MPNEIIVHHFLSGARSGKPELVEERVRPDSPTAQFLRRVEERRLNREADRSIDLRAAGRGPCRKVLYKHLVLWLDDASLAHFRTRLREHGGVFRNSTHDEIMRGDFPLLEPAEATAAEVAAPEPAPAPAQFTSPQETGPEPPPAAPSPEPGASELPKIAAPQDDRLAACAVLVTGTPALPLGHYFPRLEQRIRRTIAVTVRSPEQTLLLHTQDLSAGGMRVMSQHPLGGLEAGGQVSVTLTEPARRFGAVFSDVPYTVVSVDKGERSFSARLRRADADSRRNTAFESLLEGWAHHRDLDLEDDILSARAWMAERLLALGCPFVPLFIGMEGEALRILAIGRNPGNERELDPLRRPTGAVSWRPLTTGERPLYALRAALHQGRSPLIALYRDKHGRPLSVCDQECASPAQWRGLLAALSRRADFRVYQLAAAPAAPISCMKAVQTLSALSDKALDEAEQFVERTRQIACVALMVDVTELVPLLLRGPHQHPELPAITHGNPSRPEVLELGYLSHRREERFLVALTAACELDGETRVGRTVDLSVSGACIVLPGEVRTGSGAAVRISYPQIHSGLFQRMKAIPYTVVRAEPMPAGETRLHLRLVRAERFDFVPQVIAQLIERNADRMPLDVRDTALGVEAIYFGSLLAENLPAVPLLVGPDRWTVGRSAAAIDSPRLRELFESGGASALGGLITRERAARWRAALDSRPRLRELAYVWRAPTAGPEQWHAVWHADIAERFDELSPLLAEAGACALLLTVAPAHTVPPEHVQFMLTRLSHLNYHAAHDVRTEFNRYDVVVFATDLTDHVLEHDELRG